MDNLKEDANGIQYTEGNRKTRRMLAFQKKIKEDELRPPKKVKLVKELWEKNKSKFLHPRLKQIFGNMWFMKNINDIQ